MTTTPTTPDVPTRARRCLSGRAAVAVFAVAVSAALFGSGVASAEWWWHVTDKWMMQPPRVVPNMPYDPVTGQPQPGITCHM